MCFRFKISIDRSSQIPKQRMDTQQLRCFLEVARRQSFSQAAEALYLSHVPPLPTRSPGSKRSWTFPLFDRRARQAELTPAGQLFHRRAGPLLEQLQQAVELSRKEHHLAQNRPVLRPFFPGKRPALPLGARSLHRARSRRRGLRPPHLFFRPCQRG